MRALAVLCAMQLMVILAMSGTEAGDAGLASGLNKTAQQAGAAVGTAVRVDEGAALASALRDGYSLAFLTAGRFVVAALLLVATLLRPARR